MKKKIKIIIVISFIVLVVALGVTSTIVLLVHNKTVTEPPIEVSALEQLVPLSESNSSKASELIKSNIVKVINKVDDNTSIIGTGFFDKSGYLVTNSHLVDIKGIITIEYANGKTSEAQLYSNDITSDIALLTVENPSVKSVFYGETLSLNVTDDVYAIGYPFALEGEASVSKGVLSARRSAGGIEFLQSDISLNTGNSGGPLINDKGELIGINTYATENASIGMSISSESLQNIISNLINSKSINYLEDIRPQNALSVVLTEIGYSCDDIYHEKDYINKHRENKNDETNEIKQDNADNENKDNKSDIEDDYINKSSNALLSSLSIANYNIDFHSTTFEYYIVLKNDENSLVINAATEDKASTFTINNNNNFVDGQNTVSILVKAEDGTTKEYKINVTKPLRYLEGAAGILCCLDVQKYNGVNSLVVSGCDFIDSDRVRIYSNVTLDVVESVKLDIYAGWNDGKISGNDTDGKAIRFLNSYTFSPAYSYGIPLTELRSLLNDDDYEGGEYAGADLTVYVTAKTRKQGSFSSSMPWGLSK